jgi:hypothetical protein
VTTYIAHFAACRSCGAEIEWAVTETGRRIPLDADDDPNGNLRVYSTTEGGAPVVRVCDAGTGDRVSHFVTCPDAKTWRARK